MTTIEELKYYCNEPSPVGALMLTGEWGCGKTYLIEHILKNALSDTHVILRISLFGISSIEAIDECVHKEWVKAYLEDKEWNEKSETVIKLKDKFSKLPLPENIKNILSFDPTTLLDVSNELNGKKVVLVFDDLERCKLDTVDVLGSINEYCENRDFCTIVIANEDKLNTEEDTKSSIIEKLDFPDNNESKTTIFVINYASENHKNETLAYDEIKEKIIERTVKYIPDYKSIVHTIIEKMSCKTKEYHNFLIENELNIQNVFAPEIIESSAEDKRPHNIRSLKCALQDFYRVYKVLIENDFKDLDKWLCSFVSYTLAHKANIAKEGQYGTLFTDDDVKSLYEHFDDFYYMFSAVKHWILHGEWNTQKLNGEINRIKEQERAVEPSEIVRTHRVVDIDEEVFSKGFPDVLNLAYNGNLTLYEYVSFIMNCYWARTYDLDIPNVDWTKVCEGINTQINHLIEQNIEDAHTRANINEENKEHFLPEEWGAYTLIRDFWENNKLTFNINKKLYLATISDDPSSAFIKCQNKCFNSFDIEMAEATICAFKQSDNYTKIHFANDFSKMWRYYADRTSINLEETVAGFERLLELLEKSKEEFQEANKKISVIHTESFINSVKQLIQESKTE